MRFVLVHGASHGAWCWDLLVPELNRLGHEAVAPDLPGHGTRATGDCHAQRLPRCRSRSAGRRRHPRRALHGGGGGGSRRRRAPGSRPAHHAAERAAARRGPVPELPVHLRLGRRLGVGRRRGKRVRGQHQVHRGRLGLLLGSRWRVRDLLPRLRPEARRTGPPSASSRRRSLRSCSRSASRASGRPTCRAATSCAARTAPGHRGSAGCRPGAWEWSRWSSTRRTRRSSAGRPSSPGCSSARPAPGRPACSLLATSWQPRTRDGRAPGGLACADRAIETETEKHTWDE